MDISVKLTVQASSRCMQMEKGPCSGWCDRWRRRSHSKVPASLCAEAFLEVSARFLEAVGSSYPDENQCEHSHGRSNFSSVVLSEEREVMPRSAAWKRKRRNGASFSSGRLSSREVASFLFRAASRVGMIKPRLKAGWGIRLGLECQLMRAAQSPASLTPIQVPSPCSLG